MIDLKNWYLGGMVAAADKAEFKEDEHPRGKGGMFVKKGEGGGGSSALERVDAKGKEVDLSAKGLLVDAFKMGDSGAGGVSHEKSAEMTLANWDKHSIADAEKLLGMYEKMDGDDGWRATMQSAIKTYIQDRKDLEKMDDVALGNAGAKAINGKDKVREHMIREEEARRYADKVSKMDDGELDEAVKANERYVERYGTGEDNPYVRDLEISKAEKSKRKGEKTNGIGSFKTNSELYSLISQDAGKFDELESEAMKSVGKNMEAYMAAKKSGDSELAKKKMELAKAGERVTERFAMIRQLHSLKSTADRFHVDGNTYMEDVYRKHTDKYRKRFEEQFGEI